MTIATALPIRPLFFEFKKRADDQQLVIGIATSEAIDGQEEVVDALAIKSALADFMKWANLREMHEQKAVGLVLKAEPMTGEVEIDGKKIVNPLRIEAKVHDKSAWEKVRDGVYKGFSIGGKVLESVLENINGTWVRRITKLLLTEISLVDRPANPDAAILMWKRAADDAWLADSNDNLFKRLQTPAGPVTLEVVKAADGWRGTATRPDNPDSSIAHVGPFSDNQEAVTQIEKALAEEKPKLVTTTGAPTDPVVQIQVSARIAENVKGLIAALDGIVQAGNTRDAAQLTQRLCEKYALNKPVCDALTKIKDLLDSGKPTFETAGKAKDIANQLLGKAARPVMEKAKRIAPYYEKDGVNLLDIENEDLTLPELRRKLEIAIESKEEYLIEIIKEDINRREKNVKAARPALRKATYAFDYEGKVIEVPDLATFYSLNEQYPFQNSPNFRAVVESLMQSDMEKANGRTPNRVLRLTRTTTGARAQMINGEGLNVGQDLVLTLVDNTTKTTRPAMRKALPGPLQRIADLLRQEGEDVVAFGNRLTVKNADDVAALGRWLKMKFGRVFNQLKVALTPSGKSAVISMASPVAAAARPTMRKSRPFRKYIAESLADLRGHLKERYHRYDTDSDDVRKVLAIAKELWDEDPTLTIDAEVISTAKTGYAQLQLAVQGDVVAEAPLVERTILGQNRQRYPTESYGRTGYGTAARPDFLATRPQSSPAPDIVRASKSRALTRTMEQTMFKNSFMRRRLQKSVAENKALVKEIIRLLGPKHPNVAGLRTYLDTGDPTKGAYTALRAITQSAKSVSDSAKEKAKQALKLLHETHKAARLTMRKEDDDDVDINDDVQISNTGIGLIVRTFGPFRNGEFGTTISSTSSSRSKYIYTNTAGEARDKHNQVLQAVRSGVQKIVSGLGEFKLSRPTMRKAALLRKAVDSPRAVQVVADLSELQAGAKSAGNQVGATILEQAAALVAQARTDPRRAVGIAKRAGALLGPKTAPPPDMSKEHFTFVPPPVMGEIEALRKAEDHTEPDGDEGLMPVMDDATVLHTVIRALAQLLADHGDELATTLLTTYAPKADEPILGDNESEEEMAELAEEELDEMPEEEMAEEEAEGEMTMAARARLRKARRVRAMRRLGKAIIGDYGNIIQSRATLTFDTPAKANEGAAKLKQFGAKVNGNSVTFDSPETARRALGVLRSGGETEPNSEDFSEDESPFSKEDIEEMSASDLWEFAHEVNALADEYGERGDIALATANWNVIRIDNFYTQFIDIGGEVEAVSGNSLNISKPLYYKAYQEWAANNRDVIVTGLEALKESGSHDVVYDWLNDNEALSGDSSDQRNAFLAEAVENIAEEEGLLEDEEDYGDTEDDEELEDVENSARGPMKKHAQRRVRKIFLPNVLLLSERFVGLSGEAKDALKQLLGGAALDTIDPVTLAEVNQFLIALGPDMEGDAKQLIERIDESLKANAAAAATGAQATAAASAPPTPPAPPEEEPEEEAPEEKPARGKADRPRVIKTISDTAVTDRLRILEAEIATLKAEPADGGPALRNARPAEKTLPKLDIAKRKSPQTGVQYDVDTLRRLAHTEPNPRLRKQYQELLDAALQGPQKG